MILLIDVPLGSYKLTTPTVVCHSLISELSAVKRIMKIAAHFSLLTAAHHNR
jgi:hypothetical protein